MTDHSKAIEAAYAAELASDVFPSLDATRLAISAFLRACQPSDAAHDYWQVSSVDAAFKQTADELDGGRT